MRHHAAQRPVPVGMAAVARAQITQAAAFLNWLTEHDVHLQQATRDDLNAWLHERPSTRRRTTGFLSWAMRVHAMPTCRLPGGWQRRIGDHVDEQHHAALLHTALRDESHPLAYRVAACIHLLYAQPITRIVQLTIHDITHPPDGGLESPC